MPIMWQELQLMAWLSESRGSKYSILPSTTLAGLAGLSGSAGGASGSGLNSPCACFIRADCDHAGEQASDTPAASNRVFAWPRMRNLLDLACRSPLPCGMASHFQAVEHLHDSNAARGRC